MIRTVSQRVNAIGITTNIMTARSIIAPSRATSFRALSIAIQNSGMRIPDEATIRRPVENANFTARHESRRPFHLSTYRLKSIDDVHVTKTEQSTLNSSNDDSSSPGGACSQGIPNLEEEEEEQEEMFVTSHPILGIGNIQEWGGPRRGGRLEEPTRFGDWERKGRCTDF